MLWAVILAGGSGTRFWPASRRKNPKQFLPLFGKKTLLEQTVERIRPLVPSSRILVLTHKEYERQVARLTKIPRSQILGEPVGRNTAPCAALAAALMLRKDPQAVLALLPSDHYIGKPAPFRKAMAAAAKLALEEGLPVTFGIKPTFPHTGFGYLELDQRLGKRDGVVVHCLKRFREKPDLGKARRYVKSKRFLWNSGIFVWRADNLLENTRAYLPRAHGLLQKILAGPVQKGLKKHYASMPETSIDYGLMERLAGGILTIPLDVEWNDLGGWQSFAKIWPQDSSRNLLQGHPLLLDSKNNIIKTGKRLVAMVGVQDLVVVDTDDALLLCSRGQTEQVREIVRKLKKKHLGKYL